MKKGLDCVVFEMIVLLLHSLCHEFVNFRSKIKPRS
jgi:hypothetical protein